MHHPFLLRFEQGTLGRQGLARFIIQWCKTAKAHREAFPALIANIKNDDIRFELIEILYEEYGNGDRASIHARLLERLLRALGLTGSDVENTPTLPAITRFGSRILDIWGNGEHPIAFGLHFGLEYLASSQQQYCARGMAKYNFLSAHEREYFDLHAKAEIRHVAYSEAGFLHYAQVPINREKLIIGVRAAESLLGALWEEFDKFLFLFPAKNGNV